MFRYRMFVHFSTYTSWTLGTNVQEYEQIENLIKQNEESWSKDDQASYAKVKHDQTQQQSQQS